MRNVVMPINFERFYLETGGKNIDRVLQVQVKANIICFV